MKLNVNKTIMTVDDSSSIRQLVSETLKNAGFKTFEAEDGIEALEKSKIVKIDLMFIDLNMPNMDGITLIKNLRQTADYRFTPLIMLTTESQEVKKLEGKKAGATGWIVKPFNPEQLLNTIQKVLR